MNKKPRGDTELGEILRTSASSTATEPELTASSLVTILGPHPATALGLDLAAEGDEPIAGWLVACILLGGRGSESVAFEAWRRLAKAGFSTPGTLARAGFPAVLEQLEEAGVTRSEATAAVLSRVCAALVERHAGSVDTLVAGADGLEDLAGRLFGLGAGFGRAAVLRFLTPLRDRWTAANDLPASPATCAAGRHLGWISDTQDEEGAPSSLAQWLACNEASATNVSSSPPVPWPRLRDVEAALDRLGRAACLRERADRCPLGTGCPQRCP